jgi:colanic acid/amylovoran biosynthesis glycosyltransferase
VAVRFAWLRRLLPRTPIALYYHGGEVPSVPDQSDKAVAAAFGDCDLVFTNTRFSRQQAIDRGCPPDRTRVLPVGFNLQEFQPPAERHYRQGGTLNLVSVGRLSEEKGIHFAIEALRLVVESGRSAVHFSIIGDGYYRSQIERKVAEYRLERHVSLLGALPAAAVREQMGAADALVLASVPMGNWAETQACAVQEAMLIKALALTSQMGGVPESIPDEMRPFSFPPGQPDAIAEANIRVYDMAPAELTRLGDAACDFVRRNYDIVQLNRKMLSELQEIRQTV